MQEEFDFTAEGVSNILEHIVYKLCSGIGKWSEWCFISNAIEYCIDKSSSNSELGFLDDLNQIQYINDGILLRAVPGAGTLTSKEIGDKWISPFVTINDDAHLSKLVYLFEHQFGKVPKLNKTDKLMCAYRLKKRNEFDNC